MYTRHESYFEGYDGKKLFFQKWTPSNPKGTIIFTHGQGEHSDAYHRLIDFFKDDSWEFIGWDLRGHGRSEGLRGYVEHFDEYIQDYEIFLEQILHNPMKSNGPVVLLCHSMGGLVQLKTLADNPHMPIQAVVCSSPALGLALPIPAWKTKGAEFINNWLPKVTLGNEIKYESLTRDPDVIAEFERDALRTNKISAAAFLGFAETAHFIQDRASEIHWPLLMLLPENDPVVSTPEAKRFFENIASNKKEIFIYPEARHEMFNDIHRKTVYQDLQYFLNSVKS